MLYLLVLLQDGLFEAKEDIYCSLVLILQRCPHHKVVVGVLVEVGHSSDAGAEAGVLVALQINQGTTGNEVVLLGQPERKGNKTPPLNQQQQQTRQQKKALKELSLQGRR